MSDMGFRHENCPKIRKECFLLARKKNLCHFLDPRHFPSTPHKNLHLLFVYVVYYFFFLLDLRLGICVEVGGRRQNYFLTPPPPSSLPPPSLCFFVPTHNYFFNTSDSLLKSVPAQSWFRCPLAIYF